MSVYERKDSRFWWMWIEGTAIRKSTGVPVGSGYQRKETRRDAEDIYNAAKTDIARGAANLPTTKARPAATFRAHAEWYRDHIAIHHRGKRRAKSIIKRLIEDFGEIDLRELDAAKIEEWKTKRATQVQPQSVNRELDMLKPLLGAAVPKYLDVNPADKVKRFRTRKFAPITILTESAERALLREATDEERALVLLGLDALLRLGDARTFKVARNKGTHIEVEDPKTGVPYQVPASKRLQTALSALPGHGGYYFAKQRTQKAKAGEWRPWSESEAFTVFKELCERADVTRGREAGGITFHSLRHTGASRASRVSKATAVMKLGGWQSLKQLARYDHPDEADLVRAVEAIGSRQAHAKPPKRKKPPISERPKRSSWRGRRDSKMSRRGL